MCLVSLERARTGNPACLVRGWDHVCMAGCESAMGHVKGRRWEKSRTAGLPSDRNDPPHKWRGTRRQDLRKSSRHGQGSAQSSSVRTVSSAVHIVQTPRLDKL